MDSIIFPLAFEGFEWALLRGLIYGLVALVLIWGAGALPEWGIRMKTRHRVVDPPRDEDPLNLPLLVVDRKGIAREGRHEPHVAPEEERSISRN